MSAFLVKLAEHCQYAVCRKRITVTVFDSQGRLDGYYCTRHGTIRVNGMHAFERSLVVQRTRVA